MKCLLAQVLDDQVVLMTREGEFRTVSLNFLRAHLPPAESELPVESLRAWRGRELELPWPPPEAAAEQQAAAAERAAAGRPGRRWAESLRRTRFGLAGWPRAGAALAAAALVAFAVLPRVLLLRPVAVVAIDINPSLELQVDRQGKVLRSAALNSDAQRVLDAQPVGGLTLDEAVNRVIDQAAAFGYLGPGRDNVVVAAVVSLASGQGPDPAAVQRDIAARLQDKGLSGFVAVSRTTATLRNDAQRDHLSVNREAVKRELTGKGVPFSEDALRSQSLAHFLRGAGLDPGELYPEGQRIEQRPEANDPIEDRTTQTGAVDSPKEPAGAMVRPESNATAEPRGDAAPNTRPDAGEPDETTKPAGTRPDSPATEVETGDGQVDTEVKAPDSPETQAGHSEEKSAVPDAPDTSGD